MKLSLSNITKLIVATIISLNYAFLNVKAEDNISVMQKLQALESGTEGRIGIYAINTENGDFVDYRGDEIFPTGCTSKVIGVAAVLKKTMSDPTLLSKKIQYSEKDLCTWSPVTEKHASEGMSVQELCAAAIVFSDNTAMNLLLKLIGGVQGMTDFARSIDDPAFRQDSDWPKEAYSGGKGNIEDSSTPKSMVESLRKIALGNVLGNLQKQLLIDWLKNCQTGDARIRSGIPKGWLVGNKTGSGAVYGSTNDIAIVWPPEHAPLLIGVYYTSDNRKAVKREDIVSAATEIIIDEFFKNDKKLKK